jgi:hypothetical protein
MNTVSWLIGAAFVTFGGLLTFAQGLLGPSVLDRPFLTFPPLVIVAIALPLFIFLRERRMLHQ